jgi:hypothetical protein
MILRKPARKRWHVALAIVLLSMIALTGAWLWLARPSEKSPPLAPPPIKAQKDFTEPASAMLSGGQDQIDRSAEPHIPAAANPSRPLNAPGASPQLPANPTPSEAERKLRPPISAEDFEHLTLKRDCAFVPRSNAQLLADLSHPDRAQYYWSAAMTASFITSDAAVQQLIDRCVAFDALQKALNELDAKTQRERLYHLDWADYPENSVVTSEKGRNAQIESGSVAALLYRARWETRTFYLSGRSERAINGLRDYLALEYLGVSLAVLDVKSRSQLQALLMQHWTLQAQAQALRLSDQIKKGASAPSTLRKVPR